MQGTEAKGFVASSSQQCWYRRQQTIEMVMENKRILPLTSNALKIIVIMAMFVDHASTWLVSWGSMLDIALHSYGRLVAPVMSYLIVDGYFHTSNVKKYLARLFLLAAVSHFPYVMYFDIPWWQATSVIWGLTLGLIALIATQRPELSFWQKSLVVLVCCALSWTANWNYITVLWIVFFGIYRGQFNKQMMSFALIGLLLYVVPGVAKLGWEYVYRAGVLLAIPLLALYNGQRGRKSRLIQWGFYAFYPLHLVSLHLFIHGVLGRVNHG